MKTKKSKATKKDDQLKAIQALVAEAAQLLEKAESFKATYNRIDEITVKLSLVGNQFEDDDGAIIRIVDNFADKNTAFKTTAIKRFELKKVK